MVVDVAYRRSGVTAMLAPVSSSTAVVSATAVTSAAGDILPHSLDTVSNSLGCRYILLSLVLTFIIIINNNIRICIPP